MVARRKLKSDIAWIGTDKITVHGLDLSRDILGKIALGDMAFLQLMKRRPSPQESVVFNALAVTLVEHGMSGGAIVARMVYTGAPEAMQAAIGAGLCTMGSSLVGSMENAARLLQEALPDPKAGFDLDALARQIVESRKQSQKIPGVGHRYHTAVDPRVPRLIEIAHENGFDGPYVKLLQSISKLAGESYGKSLPINAPGAIGAIASELGLPWQIVRGIAVMARAIGLVGHILEEMREPMAREIRSRVQAEAHAHLSGT